MKYPRWRPRHRRNRRRYLVVDYPANRLFTVAGTVLKGTPMPPTEEALQERVKEEGNFLIRELRI